MDFKSFGAGFLAGMFGKKLIGNMLNKLSGAVTGVWKVIVDATRRAFNESIKAGTFDMKQRLNEDAAEYKNPIKLKAWLKSYIANHRYRGILIQGQLYYFTYDDPLTKDRLEFYDTTPLVLSFGTYLAKTGNMVEYGINLHMLPLDIRKAFLVDIFETYKNLYKGEMYSSKPRSINELNWESLQVFVDKYGIDFAVRSYITDRRKLTVIFDYEDWGKAVMLPSSQFVGITDRELMRRYKLYIATKRQ